MSTKALGIHDQPWHAQVVQLHTRMKRQASLVCYSSRKLACFAGFSCVHLLLRI